LTIILLYCADVLIRAIPLGLFEVWLERFKSGWNGEFFDPFWGTKIRIPLLNAIFEKDYVTPYHLIMFGPVYAGTSAIEWLVLHTIDGRGWMIVSVFGVKIVPVIWIVAVWLGNATVEDILWFVFNTYCTRFKVRFPDALEKLFRGEFEWHTRWVLFHPGESVLPKFHYDKVYWVITWPRWVKTCPILEDGFQIPRFYLKNPFWIGILLVTQHYITTRFG
jgi:hypothetical protein